MKCIQAAVRLVSAIILLLKAGIGCSIAKPEADLKQIESPGSIDIAHFANKITWYPLQEEIKIGRTREFPASVKPIKIRKISAYSKSVWKKMDKIIERENTSNTGQAETEIYNGRLISPASK
jgi:hypothetical protein